MGDTEENRNVLKTQKFDQVKGSVRRFFQRADPKSTGLTTEKRFTKFLTKTTLHDRLSALELRRFIAKIQVVSSGSPETQIISFDYEK